jgi:Uma2 family endonuclease
MGEPAKSLAFPLEDDDRSWPVQGQWTYADYARLPDDGCRYEVIRGHLYVTPAPNFDHQYAVTRFSWLLTQFGVETGLGFALAAPFDILLPDGIASPIEPDIVFFRTGNQPRSGDPNFQGVPDLVIEVESPKTRKRDRTVKQDAYRDAGVPEYWRASPRTRTVTVLVLSEDRTRYVELGCFGPGDMIRSSILPGLAIAVNSLFPFL